MPKTNILKVGVTGGIGSGKSTICKIFESLGLPIYSADEQAKFLVNKDPLLKKKIIQLLGEEAYSGGVYNSIVVANIVFDDKQKLTQLNELIHPAVSRDFDQWVHAQRSSIVIKEAALLFETGSYKMLDKNILVVAPTNIRISRILARDPQRTKSEIESIMKNQISIKKAKSMADWIINNDDQPILEEMLNIYNTLVRV